MAKRKPDRSPQPEEAPQQTPDRLAAIRAEIRDVPQPIAAKRRDTRVIRSAEDLKAWERSIGELTDHLAAFLLAEAMHATLRDPENRRLAGSLAQGAGHTLKDQGPRDVTLRTARGQVVVRGPYFSRTWDRDQAGQARDPIWRRGGGDDRCTAGLAAAISTRVAMRGSWDEGEPVRCDRGQPRDLKTIQARASRFAPDARAAPRGGSLNGGETVAGRRVILATDGGRIRIRTTKRGPQTAQGRNRSRTDGRAPKVLIIAVGDEKGQRERDFLSVIEGTLGGPDALFQVMEFS